MFGKSVPLLAILIVSVLSVGAFALLTNFGVVRMDATVDKAVIIAPEADAIGTIGGNTVCREHKITNYAEIDATVQLDVVYVPDDSSVEVLFKNTVHLTEKTDFDLTSPPRADSWDDVDGMEADIKYTVVADKFYYDIYAWDLKDATGKYVLIYYADATDRFVDWGGNPALVLGQFTAAGGVIDESEYVTVSGGLPYSDDWNNGPEADYTVAPDSYPHKTGAKLWLIPLDCYTAANENGGTVSTWAPDRFLFEKDLIRYFDNTNSQVTIPAEDWIFFDFCYTFSIISDATVVAEVTLTPILP